MQQRSLVDGTAFEMCRLLKMARYFFSIDHDFTTRDDEGMELPHKQAALGEGAVILGKLLEDIDGTMPTGRDVRVVVEDEFRTPLFELKARAEDVIKKRS